MAYKTNKQNISDIKPCNHKTLLLVFVSLGNFSVNV